jgi:hypothetical protein
VISANFPITAKFAAGMLRGFALRAASCNNTTVDVAKLTPEHREWVAQNEARWRHAHEIAAKHPHLDVGDIYHVLCTIHETPGERVRRSLAHGRLRLRTG